MARCVRIPRRPSERSCRPFQPFSLSLAVIVLLTFQPTVHAQEIDLDLLGEPDARVATQTQDATDEYGEGDNKEFRVSTEDNISSLETGDLYKNNKSLFKVIRIDSKGEKGGEFVLQRIGGTIDPTPSWRRVSGAGPTSIMARESLWDLYLASGPLMHAIAFCLLLTIILSLNCAWIYRKKRHCNREFVEAAYGTLTARDFSQFAEKCKPQPGLFGTVCRAMGTRIDTSTVEDIQQRCEMEARRYVSMLRAPLKGLGLISAVAPLLGLLGTVIGIATCFQSIAFDEASASKAHVLASGIRVALFTTVGGLCVAIPAQVMAFFTSIKLNGVVGECESLTELFLHEIASQKRSEMAHMAASYVVAAPLQTRTPLRSKAKKPSAPTRAPAVSPPRSEPASSAAPTPAASPEAERRDSSIESPQDATQSRELDTPNGAASFDSLHAAAQIDDGRSVEESAQQPGTSERDAVEIETAADESTSSVAAEIKVPPPLPTASEAKPKAPTSSETSTQNITVPVGDSSTRAEPPATVELPAAVEPRQKTKPGTPKKRSKKTAPAASNKPLREHAPKLPAPKKQTRLAPPKPQPSAADLTVTPPPSASEGPRAIEDAIEFQEWAE